MNSSCRGVYDELAVVEGGIVGGGVVGGEVTPTMGELVGGKVGTLVGGAVVIQVRPLA
jgi:hypothetical protein